MLRSFRDRARWFKAPHYDDHVQRHHHTATTRALVDDVEILRGLLEEVARGLLASSEHPVSRAGAEVMKRLTAYESAVEE